MYRLEISTNVAETIEKLSLGDFNNIEVPIKFKKERGKKHSDLIPTGHPGFFLISERLRLFLEMNSFTGWKVYAIDIIDDNSIANKIWGLSITGKCGAIDFNKSEVIEEQMAPNAPVSKNLLGLYPDLTNWDNSDFFRPEKYSGIIITEKVYTALLKEAFINIRMRNIKEIVIPHAVLENQLREPL